MVSLQSTCVPAEDPQHDTTTILLADCSPGRGSLVAAIILILTEESHAKDRNPLLPGLTRQENDRFPGGSGIT
jgi:hypothetical protein